MGKIIKRRKSPSAMPTRRRFRRRLGTVRASGSRHKFTLLKAMKIGIAVGPVAGIVAGQVAASPNAAGLRSASGTLTSAYTGYDINTGGFNFGNLALGYIPLFGAWAFGKVAGRVIRW